MNSSVFDFDSYKRYLEFRVGPRSQRKGLKSAIAKALHCQATYVSQVLHGKAHLSLEQADQLNAFLGHSKEESFFFLLLVQKDRAGTTSLQRHFEEQIEQALTKRMIVTERLGAKNALSKEDQTQYYSSWHYAAIHVALTIPRLQSLEALVKFFKIPIKKAASVLEFLIGTGLAKRNPTGGYETGSTLTRIGNDSPNIIRHHANWRVQAIESLDREEVEDLHYSGVVSLSQRDAARLKDRLLERLKEDLELIRTSPEEELYTYCIDLFRVGR